MNSVSPHRLIRALLRQPVDKTPVWLMRQAGRYLPEYRNIRQKIPDFITLCRTTELACEVTLQPLNRFDLDAAIIFSDILTIPDAMGLGLHFVQHEGPMFKFPVRTLEAIENLPIPDPEIELRYVMDVMRAVKHELGSKLPVIGFSGSPWTLAAYMIEGHSSDSFSEAKKMLYQAPELLDILLSKLSDSIILYLNAQIAAGADVLMIFDTWGGLLTSPSYLRFSLKYIQKIIARLHRQQENRYVPVILFTKHGGQWLEKMLRTQCDAVGLDWTTPLSLAREKIGHAAALQGNLDPAILHTSPAAIEQETARILAEFGPHNGHVFNLGHGVPQHVPVENVEALINSVHTLSMPYHVQKNFTLL